MNTNKQGQQMIIGRPVIQIIFPYSFSQFNSQAVSVDIVSVVCSSVACCMFCVTILHINTLNLAGGEH